VAIILAFRQRHAFKRAAGVSDANLLLEDADCHFFSDTSSRTSVHETCVGARAMDPTAVPGDHVESSESQYSSSLDAGALWSGLRFV
jgi:hypothetical protein